MKLKSTFHRPIVGTVACCLVMLLGCPIHAAEPSPTPVPLSEFDQANVDWITSHTSDFEDSDAVILFDRIQTTYKDDGSAVTVEEILILFRKAAEASEYRALTYDYNARTAHIRFLDARIYRADPFAIQIIPMSNVFTSKAPAELIYWNFDSVICPVPTIQDGDALYYKIERRGLNLAYLGDEPNTPDEPDWNRDYIPPQPGYFMDTLYFDHEFPTVEKIYDIKGPSDKPLQFATGNGSVECSLKFVGDDIQYRFAVKDRPGFTEEPFSPGFNICGLKLAVASHPSWEMKSKWAFEHNEPQFVISPEMKSKVDEIIAGAETDEAKMSRLLHWVAEEIRYLGLDMGEGEGHMVHRTDEIFRERAGVCKDKAAILVSMLRAAGFDAYFVMTLAMEPTLDVPADDKFNHGVVAVRQTKGWLFLDPTWAPQNRPLFNYLEQEQPVLIGAPEGCPLMQVPYSPPEQSPMTVNAESSVNSSGAMNTIIDVMADGYMDGRFRDALTNPSNAVRSGFLNRLIESIAPNAQIQSRSFSDPRDFTKPMQMHFEFSSSDAVVSSEDRLVFVPVLSRQFFGKRYESDYLFADVELEHRTQPLELSCTRHVTLVENLRIPSGYTLETIPEKVSIKSPTLELDYFVEKTASDLVTIHQTVKVMKRITPLDEIEAMQECVGALKDIQTTPLVFNKNGKNPRDPKPPTSRRELKTPEMPIYPAIVDHKETGIQCHADGSVTESFVSDARVFTEQGRDRFADQTYLWNSSFQTISIEECYSETSNGTRIDAPQTALNTTLAGEVLKAPDYRQIQNTSASMIGVEYGNRLHANIKRHSTAPISTGIDQVVRISDQFPTTAHDVWIDFSGTPGSWHLIGGKETPQISAEGTSHSIHFAFTDLPAIQYEPFGLHSEHDRMLIVSSFKENDWPGRLASLRTNFFEGTLPDPLFGNKAEGEDEVRSESDEELAELFERKTDSIERIDALFAFLNDRCTSIDVHSRRFGYQTRSIDAILTSGYGHALDKLKVLRLLIEKAGGRFDLAFAGQDDEISRVVPSLSQFYEILGFVTLGSRSCFIDPGNGIVPESEMFGKTVLLVSAQDSEFRTITPPKFDREGCVWLVSIDATKEAAPKLDMYVRYPSAQGPFDQVRNGSESWMKKLAGKYLKKPKIKESAIMELNWNQDGGCGAKLTATGTLETKKLSRNRRLVSLKLPDFASGQFASNCSANTPRTTPLACDTLSPESVQFIFKYPKSWTFSGSVTDATSSNSLLNWKRVISHDPKKREIVVEMTLMPTRHVVLPSEYGDWVRALVAYAGDGTIPLLFETKSASTEDDSGDDVEAASDE